jgi:general L-amino acid transport system substrate-binding protein
MEKVRKRGYVICGVSNNAPGFSQVDKAGKWTGFEMDFCAALAAAVLGRSEAVKFRPLSAAARFSKLRDGDVDVLVNAASWTLGRATDRGIRYVSPLFYEGMGLLVRRDQDIASAMELTGAAFCALVGTPAKRDIERFFGSRNMSHEIVTFDTWDEAVKSFKSKRCQVLSADLSTIAMQLASMPDKDEYMILPEVIAQEPLGPAVRWEDERWFEIVRWTIFALIKAEELGVSSQNIDSMRGRENPVIRRYLGEDGPVGKSLGLPQGWTYQMIKQVGNYGEIFFRNLGAGSPLKMRRRLNNLWSSGGLFAVPTFR